MRVAVLGASLSHQAIRADTGEVTGYAEVLRRNFLDRLGASAVTQFAYPGNRLSDAGVIRALEVAAAAPGICIFEPLVEDRTRGRDATLADVRFIYRTLLAAGVLPVTFLAPNPQIRTAARWPTYAMIRALCTDHGLPMIEVDLAGISDLDAKFNGLHTLLPGAELYAGTVAESLAGLLARGVSAAQFADRFRAIPPDLHVLCIDVPPVARLTRLGLRVQPLTPGPFGIRVVQRQWIGTFSPVLDERSILHDGTETTTTEGQRSLWDPYCHFRRPSYALLHEARVERAETCEITVTRSAADPAYATSRRPVAAWPAPEERYMTPMAGIHVISTLPLRAELTAYG